MDGTYEILIATPETRLPGQLAGDGTWTTDPKPFLFTVVDANGTDSGLRFVELDKDDYDDLIVRGQTNNGVWFADDHMWGQNEDTNRLLDGVDRRTFSQLTGTTEPAPSRGN